MTLEFQKLKELVKDQKITIGVNRNHANNFWARQTLIGKILNWMTYALILLAIFIFTKFGFAKALLTGMGIGIYAVIIQKIASMHVRMLLLDSEELFEVAYQAKSVTLRNNQTGKIIYFPADWRHEISDL